MSYEPYYSGGWKSGDSGGTPITPAALNHFDEGIAAALPADKLIAVYGAPIDFDAGVGYYENSAITASSTVAFVQLRASSITTITKTTLAVTALDGKLQIVMDYEKTVSALPVNILLFLP